MGVIRFVVHAGATLLAAAAIAGCTTGTAAVPAGGGPRQSGAVPLMPEVLTKGNPSVFQAWTSIESVGGEDELELIARHDLVFSAPWLPLEMSWLPDATSAYEGFATRFDESRFATARARRQRLADLNPHLVILVSLDVREGRWVPEAAEGPAWWQQSYFPPDSALWLRDARGAPIPAWGEDADGDGTVEPEEAYSMLVDFRRQEVQDLIVAKAVAVKESGLYHGIMFDWWNEAIHGATTDAIGGGWSPVLSADEEWAARLSILRKVREKVGDDFLILVNANYRTIPGSAPYVNGIFMECFKDRFERSYTAAEIRRFEETLLWAEANLKQPRINCLEGWRVVEDYHAGPEWRIAERTSTVNQRWMRLFTAMSLTLSDGYVLFGDDNALPGPDHQHGWYPLWDVDLGPATSARAATVRGIDGLYLREFLRGWAVYNRSGSARTVEFDGEVTRASSGGTGTSHRVENLDGEVFLKR